MSDVMPTVAASTATDTPESMVARARQMLSDRRAPINADNLNRAMQMITQSADAPTDFNSMVEQSGNPTARPRSTAQLPVPPAQPTPPVTTQGAATSSGSGTASVDTSAASTPAASGATQPATVPPQIAAMLDGDTGGQMMTPGAASPQPTATDSNGLTPAIPPQIAAMLDGDSGGMSASGMSPSRGAAPPTDLETALQPGVELPSQQPPAQQESSLRLRTGAEMMDDPIASIMARSMVGASGGLRTFGSRPVPVNTRPGATPGPVQPAPIGPNGVPRGQVPISTGSPPPVAPGVPSGPMAPRPPATAEVSPDMVVGELRRLLASRNPPSPSSLPARPAATPGGRPIEGATPAPSVNTNPSGPPAPQPPRGNIDPKRVAKEAESQADRVQDAQRTGSNARQRRHIQIRNRQEAQ